LQHIVLFLRAAGFSQEALMKGIQALNRRKGKWGRVLLPIACLLFLGLAASTVGVCQGESDLNQYLQAQSKARQNQGAEAAASTTQTTERTPTRPLTESQPEKLRPILSVLRSSFSIEEAPSVVVDPNEYVLGPGDVMAVHIRGLEPAEYDLVVSPEGTLSIPEVGTLRVNDVVLEEARQRIISEILKYRKNVELDVFLEALRRIKINIRGQVAQPGSLSVPPYTRVAEILCAAGGVLDSGTERYVEVIRGDSVLATIDLAEQLVLGGQQEEPRLEGGDVVFVPYLRGRLIGITGEVVSPGFYELKDGENLPKLLALCGGVTPTGIASRASLERTTAEGTREVESLDLNNPPPGFELSNGDTIDVPSLLQTQARISVSGEVVGSDKLIFVPATEWQNPAKAGEKTGAYRLRVGETVGEVIRSCGGLTARADRRNAFIRRKGKAGEAEEIPLDLAGVEEGTTQAAQTALEPGDELLIPAIIDQVYVAGQVQNPGPVPYRSNYDLMDYIGEAGTPTGRAKMSSIIIASFRGPLGRSVKVDARAYERAKEHIQIYPGDMIIVPERTIARWQDVATIIFAVRNMIQGWGG
jgi:protein involved in polysaccharide export with SLBB domain